MRSMTMTNATNITTNDQAMDKLLMQVGLAQPVFIFLQSLFFPALGILGAMIAAQCALMPWLVPMAKKAPSMAVAMSMSSAILTPIFSLMCLYALDFVRGF